MAGIEQVCVREETHSKMFFVSNKLIVRNVWIKQPFPRNPVSSHLRGEFVMQEICLQRKFHPSFELSTYPVAATVLFGLFKRMLLGRLAEVTKLWFNASAINCEDE